MSLIYCGIDEAGYGPLLGPLCVAMVVIEVENWTPGEPAPDLWRLLSKGVCRKPSDTRGRVPVADSKKLKLPNDSRKRHPLTHLERGVLAFLAGAGAEPETDSELFFHLEADLDDQPWYQGDDLQLPHAITPAQRAIATNLVARALSAASIRILDMRCDAVGESAYNDTVREAGTKAETTASSIRSFFGSVQRRWRGRAPIRIICDRQSGRTDYRDIVEQGLGESGVEALEQSPRASRYGVGDDVRVTFQPEAENAHMPVALASMTAKLVRELAMARFNRYWCTRMPELKPTAGYRQDAWRWLRDAEGVITPAERASMIRLA